MRIELLGTAGCHLCDKAQALVYQSIESEASGRLRQCFSVQLIDIADDPVLLEQFATSIPVMRVASGQAWYWPFPEPAELQAQLSALIEPVSQTP